MVREDRFDRHARLVTRMADTLGVDIEASVQQGRMLPEEFDFAVMNCMGCPTPARCEGWTQQQDAVVGAAPAYCRNRDALEALARS